MKRTTILLIVAALATPASFALSRNSPKSIQASSNMQPHQNSQPTAETPTTPEVPSQIVVQSHQNSQPTTETPLPLSVPRSPPRDQTEIQIAASPLATTTTPLIHSAQRFLPQPTTTTPSASPIPRTQPQPASQSQFPALQINTCNGQVSSANFRQTPTLNPNTILGIVPHRASVFLTGKTTQQGRLLWLQAVAPALQPSIEPAAQNKLRPNQLGWIASCFSIGDM